MTGNDHNEDYTETMVLPGRIDADEPDLDETVVLDEERRLRIERGDAVEPRSR